jgi:hypothetical protein
LGAERYERFPKSQVAIKITPKPGVEPEEETLVFVTSDKDTPVYRLKLVPEQKGNN